MGFTLWALGQVRLSLPVPRTPEDRRHQVEKLERQRAAITARLEALRPAIEATLERYRQAGLSLSSTRPSLQSVVEANASRMFPCELVVECPTNHLSKLVVGGLTYSLTLFLDDGTPELVRALVRECTQFLEMDPERLAANTRESSR